MSNNFKHTDIGLIPVDWELKKLREVSDVKAGGNAPQGEKYFQDGKNLFIRVQHFDGDKEYVDRYDLITDEAVEEYNLKIFPQDSILFPKSGASIHLEKRAKLPFKSYIVSHLAVLNSYDIINNDFLFYLTKKMKFAKSADGSTLPYLNINQLKEEYIPFPPLPEQKKIAYVLSKIQQAIETQEQIIKTTQELKKALMQKLFTEGLPASGGTEPEPQKQTEIGPIPESWEVINLEDTGDVVYGIQASVAHLKKPIGLPILTNKNIAFDGRIDLSELNYFELKTKRHFNTILKKGDILFNWRSGSIEHVGKSAYFDLDGEYVHSSFILRIRPKEGINNKYLFYYLTHLRQSEYFIKLHSYSINAKFNKSAVNNLPTALPNPDKQELIANYLSTADQKIVKEEASLRSLQELFNSMLNNLMTGQIRVKDIEFEIEKTQLSLLEKGRRDVLEW